MRTNLAFVLLSFVRLAEDSLLAFASSIIKGMTKNAYFVGTAELLTALVAAFSSYQEALDEAKKGGKTQKSARNAARAVLLTALREMVTQVNYEQRGNRTALDSTNFSVSKEAAVPQELKPVKKVTITNPNSSDIKVVAKKGDGTQTVTFKYSTADVINADTVWNISSGKRATLLLQGMPVGKYLTVQIITTGSNNQKLTTEIVRRMIA